MSSISGFSVMHGSKFGAAVGAADEVSPTAPARKPSLPDNTIAVLMELGGSTAADRKERDDLISERFHLNNKTLAYIERQLTARAVDLETQHENIKAKIREQGKVLEGLKKTLIEGTADWIRLDNASRLAQSAAHDAEVDLKGLSRFASKKEIDEAEKRFTGPDGVSHVGIFVGNGVMVDAPHTGADVRLDQINGFEQIVGVTAPGQ